MANARVSSKGQVVIPKSVRDQMGIKDGTRLDFSCVNDNVVVKVIREKKRRFTNAELLAQGAAIKPEDRPVFIDFGDEPVINDGWVGKPMDEYASTEEMIAEWNEFVAKSR